MKLLPSLARVWWPPHAQKSFWVSTGSASAAPSRGAALTSIARQARAMTVLVSTPMKIDERCATTTGSNDDGAMSNGIVATIVQISRHDAPSPTKPPLQAQVRLPSVLVHPALASQPPLLVAHS